MKLFGINFLPFAFTLIFSISLNVSNATVVYVKSNASGAGTGLTWADAFTTVQAGISSAIFGDTIWVAAGTYKAANFDRTLSFNLKNGTYLAGGFSGTETDFSQRNSTVNVTTLSGDIGTLGVASDNTYHIVTAYSCNFTTYFDGFRVMDGNATFGHPYGGGMDIEDSRMVVRNCTFINNQTVGSGGAVYALLYSLEIDNCTFSYNLASGSGGAVSMGQGDIKITNTRFIGNEATASGGGALSTDYGYVIVDRCIFAGNTCDVTGSALYAAAMHDSCTISNSLFVGNVSYYGPVIELSYSQGTIGNVWANVNNCTIAHNTSVVSTGNSSYRSALVFDNSSSYTKRLNNTIIYGNRAYQAVEGIGTSNIRNCITDQSSLTSNGNLVTNPQFVSPAANYNAAPFVLAGYDYHLSSFSPGVDGGNNTGLWAPYLKDLDAVLRPHGVANDIGSYENNYCTFTPQLTLSNDSIFCDGQQTTITAPEGLSYLWTGGFTSRSIVVSTSGIYTLQVVDSANCRGTAEQSIQATIANAPITLSGNATFCAGTSLTLTAPQASNYHWSNGANGQSITVTASGTYAVTTTGSDGCRANGSQSVTAAPVAVNITGSNVVCSGQTIVLTASGTAGSTYLWNTNNTTTTITTTQAGTYSVTITTGAGCTASASKTVTQQSTVIPAVSVVSSAMVCQGQPLTFTATVSNGGNNPALLWQTNGVSTGFSGNPYTPTSLANGTQVTVQLTSNAACANPQVAISQAVTASFYPLPATPVVTQNGNTLTSSAPTNNQWYLNGSPINGATGTAYTVTQTGYYNVLTTDANGCQSAGSTVIQVLFNGIDNTEADALLVYPNPATDVVHILSSSNKPEAVEFYNTYGQLVLSALVANQQSINIEELPAGVYNLRIKTNDIWITKRLVKQ